MKMSRRDEWNRVLAIELQRWNTKPWSRLRAELEDGNVAYEVVVDSKTYQVEVDLLEDTQAYLHVSVAVDDGPTGGIGARQQELHPQERS